MKVARRSHRGFTLVEIMIVVLIIGILAAMARIMIARINLRSRAAAYWNDCRVFTEGFNRYAQERGQFPPDQPARGLFPPNMDGYLNRTQWLRVTPIGGDYDFDSGTSPTGRVVRAAIRVNGGTLSMAQLLQIDKWYDDGNLATGNLQVASGGATVMFIIEWAN